MTWLGILFWVLTHASDLYSLLQAILALIHSLPKGDRALAKAEVEAAIHGGDKAEVKAVMEKWKQKCEFGGVGCGGDLLPNS